MACGSPSAPTRACEFAVRTIVEIDKLTRPNSGSDTFMPRTAAITRKTAETDINLPLNLDGTGKAEVSTGVGFFDHMLTHLGKHGLFDLTVTCKGDLHIDAHHTVEDVGICFGKALVQALGDKAGIRRYGDCTLPMDETLATAAVDLSGRPFLVWNADVPLEMLGTFSSQLGRRVLAGRLVRRASEPSRRAAPRPEHAPHRRGDLQGLRPGPACGRRTRPAGDGSAFDEGRSLTRKDSVNFLAHLHLADPDPG